MPYDPNLDDQMSSSNSALRDSFARNPVTPNPSPIVSAAAAAPEPSLNDSMASSNAALKDSFARNPVIPNQAPGDAGPERPLGPPQAGFARLPIPPRLGGPFTNFVDRVSNAFGDGSQGITKPSPSAAAVVPSATVPRPAAGPSGWGRGSADRQAGDPGPITSAVQDVQPDLTPGITRTGNSFSGVGNGAAQPAMTTEQANQFYGAQNRVARAAEQQRAYDQAGFVEQRAREDANRPSYGEMEQAKSAARVAAFNKQYGQVSGNQFGRNLMQGKAAFAEVSDAANKRLSDLEAAQRAPGVQPPKATYVQDAQETNEAGNKNALSQSLAQRTAAEGAESKSRIALTAEELKQKKQFSDLVAGLSAKTPAERASAQKSLLAFHGKTEPGWKAVSLGGGVNPETNQANPQSVLLYNEQTGEKEHYDGNGKRIDGASAEKPNFTKGQTGTAKDGSKVVWDGTKWVKA